MKKSFQSVPGADIREWIMGIGASEPAD